jgi:hypothetical protein
MLSAPRLPSIESIIHSLPEEVRRAIRERASSGTTGVPPAAPSFVHANTPFEQVTIQHGLGLHNPRSGS